MLGTNLQTLFELHHFSCWCPFSDPGSHAASSYHVSLVSSNLWQFPHISLSPKTSILFRVRYFVLCLSFLVQQCLIVIRLWLSIFGKNTAKVMLCPSTSKYIRSGGTWCWCVLSLVTLTWIVWQRGCLPGSSIVKSVFTLWLVNVLWGDNLRPFKYPASHHPFAY